MNVSDRLGGFLWIGISIFVCVESIGMNIGTFQNPGPGFLLFWLGVILGMLALSLIVKSTLKKEGREKIKDLWRGVEWIKIIFALTSLLIYAILLSPIGYLITTFGLLTFLFGIVGKSKLWVRVLSSLITTLVTYIIFVWLDVRLPKGIFGF